MIGLSGYVFLSVIGHGRFDSVTSAALSSTYLLINIVGPGVFVAIEQESSRTVSHAMALHQEPAAGIRRMLMIAAGLAVAILLIIGITSPVLLSQVLDQEFGLLLMIALSVIGSSMVFLLRGIFGGQTRFGNYAWTLMIDGGVRLVGCVLLALLGNESPTSYASVLAAGPVLASLMAFLTRPGRKDKLTQTFGRESTKHYPAPSWSSLIRGVLWLLISSVLWMSMANIAPVIVTATLPSAPDIAAGFAVALVLTRVPLLLMGPIQALFLPRLARFAAAGESVGFRRDLVKGLILISILGAGSIVAYGLIGRWVIVTLFGAPLDTTSATVLVLLAISSTVLMAVMLLQPGLVALRSSGPMVLGWIVGTVVFLGCFLLLPVGPLNAAIFAQLAGPIATLAVHAVAIVRALNSLSRTNRAQASVKL